MIDLDLKRHIIRMILAKAYKSPGYGYGGYGGGKKYRPRSIPKKLKTNKPVEIPFRHQRLSPRTKYDLQGMYVVWVDPKEADGVAKLKRPLVIPWGASKGPDNWAVKLHEKFGTKPRTGELYRHLSKSLRYDGIVTIRGNLNSNQLDLFYDILGHKKPPGKPYQIVIFDESDVEVEKPSAEDVMERYFDEAPYYDVTDFGGEQWSEVLQRHVDTEDLRLSREEKEARVGDYEYQEADIESEMNDALGIVIGLSDLRDEVEEYINQKDEVDSILYRLDFDLELQDDEEELESVKEQLEVEREALERAREGIEEGWSNHRDIISLERLLEGDAVQIDTEIEGHQILADEREYDLWYTREKISELNDEVTNLEYEEYDREHSGQAGNLDSDTETKILKLAGVYGLITSNSYDIEIKDEGYDTYKVIVEGDNISTFERVIDFAQGTIENEHLELSGSAPKGLGTRILYSQALAAKAEGFKYISCTAARGMGYIGYYTWARLGYSGSVRPALIAYRKLHRDRYKLTDVDTLREMVKRGLFPEYVTPETPVSDVSISDLMISDQGASWWKENGQTWKAIFDLEDGVDGEPSRSMQVISSYVSLKEEARGESLNEWVYKKASALKPKGPPEIDLTEEDFFLLDIVWDQIREKEMEKRFRR